MRSKCVGQRKSLTVQLNSRPVKRIELVRKSVLLHKIARSDRIGFMTKSQIKLHNLGKPLIECTLADVYW